MKDPNNPCLFCNINESGLAKENNLAYASYDTFPVSEGHCLIIPKSHVKDYFDLCSYNPRYLWGDCRYKNLDHNLIQLIFQQMN